MREEVLLLPPCAQRRKGVTAMEESKDLFIRKLALSDQKTVEKFRHAISVNPRQTLVDRGNASELVGPEKAKNGKDHLVKQEKGHEEENFSKEMIKNGGSFSLDQTQKSSRAAPVLHWGSGKRIRCSRLESHHRKPCDLAYESSALLCKRQKVQADRISVTVLSNVSKVTHELKSRVGQKRDHPWSPQFIDEEHADIRAKSSRGTPPDLRHGKRSIEQRGHPNVAAQTKQDPPIHGTLPHHKLASPNRCVITSANVDEAGHAKVECSWPKYILTLSRREKEEDFLIFKGSKLPQRPKRRPKAAEKALYYCTPGNSLANWSHSRYEVREKKGTKKKPRGLKAMEGMETDSE